MNVRQIYELQPRKSQDSITIQSQSQLKNRASLKEFKENRSYGKMTSTNSSQEVTEGDLIQKVQLVEERLKMNRVSLPEDARLKLSMATKAQWSRIITKISKKTKKAPDDTLIERSNWDHRKKIEVNRVIDLSKDLIEKYGGNRGWQFGLRFNQNDGPLLYREPISFTNGTGCPLAAQLHDDRTSPVEMIRKPIFQNSYIHTTSPDKTMYQSRSESSFLKYSIQSDNSIIQRGISQQKLQKYVPTLQLNSELSKLLIEGSSKYKSEKETLFKVKNSFTGYIWKQVQ